VYTPSLLVASVIFGTEDKAWQIAASFGIVVLLIGGMLMTLSYSSFGITRTSIFAIAILLNLIALMLVLTRARYKIEWRFINKPLHLIHGNKHMVLGCLLLLFFLTSTLSVSTIKGVGFSEFFFAQSQLPDKSAPWLQQYSANSAINITLGVRSHEAETAYYYVRIIDNGVERENIDLGSIHPEQEKFLNISLPNSLAIEHRYRFYLYRGESNEIYRELSFSIGQL
jgi:hypothetical protein